MWLNTKYFPCIRTLAHGYAISSNNSNKDRKAMESHEIRWRDGLQYLYNCTWINPQVSAGQVSSMSWEFRLHLQVRVCMCMCECQARPWQTCTGASWPWVTLCHWELSLAHAEHSWKRARAWGTDCECAPQTTRVYVQKPAKSTAY